MDWQPIETAPEDDTVDLWVRHIHTRGEYRIANCFQDPGTGWCDGNGIELYKEKPLFWMPLPPPPQGTDHAD